MFSPYLFFFFFFNDTATTEIYTLSLHDALPISSHSHSVSCGRSRCLRGRAYSTAMIVYLNGDYTDRARAAVSVDDRGLDRKSTRLNSSHGYISYAVFCLKKKKKQAVSQQSLRQC